MMERLQGPINSCFFGEVNCLEQGFVDAESLRLEEEQQLLISSFEDNMPFLQMLQSVEHHPQQFFPLNLKEPSFQTLLRLQHLKKPWELESQAQAAYELESCVTHDMYLEMQSPVKSESNELQQQHQPHSASCVEKVLSYECNQEEKQLKTEQSCPESQPATTREKRKRKRTRSIKNKEDVENQRMTHIAVERNRRRQMNDHLSVLRSLMPPAYTPRGDQASVIGGAIDFVKELEQLVQSLESQKRIRKNEEGSSSSSSNLPKPSSSTSLSSPAFGMRPSSSTTEGDEVKAENKSDSADIKVTLIQTHVNLKIECERKPGQLLKVIVALEDLRLTILHLNITSSEASVIYSLNLKIEEDCMLSSANEIAEAVHHILCIVNGS